VSPTHQYLSNDTTFNQIKFLVPVPLRCLSGAGDVLKYVKHTGLGTCSFFQVPPLLTTQFFSWIAIAQTLIFWISKFAHRSFAPKI